MKLIPLFVLGCLCSLGSAFAQAQSSIERDLATLIEQRDRAIISAQAPIHDKFQKALENLLNLALNSKDEQAAHKIRAVLSSNERFRNGDRLDLRYPLRGSVWTITPGSPIRPGLRDKITFEDVSIAPINVKYLLTKDNEVIVIFDRGDSQIMKLDAFGTKMEFLFQGKSYSYQLATSR